MTELATTEDFDGEQAYVLRAADGTEAWVLPQIGANCVALLVPQGAGTASQGQAGQGQRRTAHLLATPPSVAALRGHPTGWGFPILSPHPGSNRTPFTWQGRHYEPHGDRGRLPGHGFAAGASWEVVAGGPQALISRLDTRRLPAAEYWPWPFELQVTHHVEPGRLTLSFEMHNLSGEPAPLLFGLHPYFPLRFLPVDAAGADRPLPAAALAAPDDAAARRACRVWVDSDRLWLLQRGVATGETRPATGWRDLRQPRTIGELAEAAAGEGVLGPDGHPPLLYFGLADALSGAAGRGQAGAAGQEAPDAPGGIASGVDDAGAGLRLTLETSRAFGTVAAYFPDRPSLSLEPRTALPDALTLAGADPSTPTGLHTLAPGETWRAWSRLVVQHIPA